MLIKKIHNSWDWERSPNTLIKSAAWYDKFNITPEEGYIYVNAIFLGAGEYWGPNKNGDYFPEKELLKTYKTFVSHGKHYKHHVNGPNDEIFGEVVAVRYNMNMHRVEGVIKVEIAKSKPMVDKINKGEAVPLSMAARVPYDVCSDCGNKATCLAEYCDHLRYEMCKVRENGIQVCAINYDPQFFDISEVVKGADVTAYTLEKVASLEKKYLQKMSLLDKIAILERIAALEKKIDAILTSTIPIPAKALEKQSYLNINDCNEDLISALATTGIALSPNDIKDGHIKLSNDCNIHCIYQSILNLPNREKYLASIPCVELGNNSLNKYASSRSLLTPHVNNRLLQSINGNTEALVKKSHLKSSNVLKAAYYNLASIFSNPSLLQDQYYPEMLVLQNHFM